MPSPVLKLAWQRMQTYIFELDIIGLTPGSALGRAAVYSAWVWRSLTPLALVVAGVDRRVAIDGQGRAPRRNANPVFSLETCAFAETGLHAGHLSGW